MKNTFSSKFGKRRIGVDWKLLLSIFVGFIIIGSVASATPMYLESLQQISFKTSLERMQAKFLTFQIFASDIPLTEPALNKINESLDDAIREDLGNIFIGREVYYKTSTNLVGLPSRPLPSGRDQGECGGIGASCGFENQGPITSRGSFQYLSNLEPHATFLCNSFDRDGNEVRCGGRMPGSEMVATHKGPAVEVAISANTQLHFDLAVGDILTLTPDLGSPHVLYAQISGIFDKADSDMFNLGTDDGYWNLSHIFLDQAPLGLPPQGEAPPPGINVDPNEPPVVLFVTRKAMLDIIGPTYPGTVIDPIWTVRSSKKLLKDTTIGDANRRLDSFEAAIRRGFEDVPLGTPSSSGSISEVGGGHEVYFKGSTNLVELPNRPLPDVRDTGEIVARGSFQHISHIERYGRLLSGKMPSNSLIDGPDGPIIEASISSATKSAFDLNQGDIVTLHWPLSGTTTVASPIRLSAKISGVFEKADPSDPFWNIASEIFEQPPLGIPPFGEPPPGGVSVDPEEPPVILFITRDIMLDVYSKMFPEGLISPVWTVPASQTRQPETSLTQNNIPDFEFEPFKKSFSQISISMGPVQNLIKDINRKSFFSSVPLLLLSSAMVVTVLFYVLMLVGYLVQGRIRDAALLRSRGMGSVKMARMYGIEGILLALFSMALSAPLAVTLVSTAGKLPYFSDVTLGNTLPARVSDLVLMTLGATGLLCFILYFVPPLFTSRISPLLQKLRTSRPPSIPFMHKYYIDVALVVAGGLFYWELQARGRFISEGLFGDVGVNEALLLAPGIFMIVAALVFLRLFPLLVSFINGDSPKLTHVICTFSVISIASVLLFRTVQGEEITTSITVFVLVIGLGLAYRLTNRTMAPILFWAGIIVQVALTAGFIYLDPIENDDLLFIPMIGILSLVPLQIAFRLLQHASNLFPVWISVGLSRMARNPLQYTWLVILLVLATGLSILATTVGGTLLQSQEDRIQYELPTDMRVSGIPLYTPGGLSGVMDKYLESPDISAASLAIRTSGYVNGRAVQVFALESAKTTELDWYFREDFSETSLADVMSVLSPSDFSKRVVLPDGSSTIGLWVKPGNPNPNLAIWVVLEDKSGRIETISMGKLGHSDWRLHTGKLPSRPDQSFELVSIQVFRSGVATSARAGSLWIDDIYVTTDDSNSVWANEERILIDFEQHSPQWVPIITSSLSRDKFSVTNKDAYNGVRSGLFAYGKDTALGVRGFYRSPAGNDPYIPVVISRSLSINTGYDVGDVFFVDISGRSIPAVVRGLVNYFPTMLEGRGSFIIADLKMLLGTANLVGNPAARSTTEMRPNEIFLKKTLSSEPVEQVLDDVTTMIADIDDRGVTLESIRRNPFSSAGWSGAVLLSLFVVILSASFGYGSYLLLFAIKSKYEVGFLKAIGLSRFQMVSALGFEHLGIAGLAVGVGVWTGIQMSKLMVSPLAITENGQPVVPPFVLVTDWGLLAPVLASMIIIFIVSLFIIGRSIAKVDLNALARSAESQ
jgi:ABC-type lipoprotein release transport system permease subunit